MLYDGAKDCSAGFMAIGFAGTFEQRKPSLQKSMDKYLPLFEKVHHIFACGRFEKISFGFTDSGLRYLSALKLHLTFTSGNRE